jgi:beta-glucosidase
MSKRLIGGCMIMCLAAILPVFAQGPGGRGGRGGTPAVTGPWSDKSMPPDRRADLLIEKMTLDEKIQLLHGSQGGRGGAAAAPTASRSNGGAGWVPGIQRLGMPDINMADSAVGVTRGAAESRYSTLLPSALGLAASWNSDLGLLYGQVIGRELRDQGYNMSIGGGVNITREPRNGRRYESRSCCGTGENRGGSHRLRKSADERRARRHDPGVA